MRCAIPEGLYLLFVERVPQYLDWDLSAGGRPLRALARPRVVYGWALLFFLWHLREIIRRAASPEGCRHLPDLLPRLRAPVRRKHPHPAKRSDVCDPAVRPPSRWPWGSGSGHSRRAWKLAAVGGLCRALPRPWMDDGVLGRQRRASRRSVDARPCGLGSWSRGQGGEAPLSALAARIGASQLLRAGAHHCVADDRREVSS